MTVIAHTEFQRPKWRTLVLVTLAFWLSSSLILDLVIMPTMYATGMMATPDFATAGYSLFWIFNRIELLCAAIALTGLLVLRNTEAQPFHHWAVPLSLSLLGISLICTYGLTPEMSSLGLQLNLFETGSGVPGVMNQMHSSYWLLELLKLGATGLLLNTIYKQTNYKQTNYKQTN